VEGELLRGGEALDKHAAFNDYGAGVEGDGSHRTHVTTIDGDEEGFVNLDVLPNRVGDVAVGHLGDAVVNGEDFLKVQRVVHD